MVNKLLLCISFVLEICFVSNWSSTGKQFCKENIFDHEFNLYNILLASPDCLQIITRWCFSNCVSLGGYRFPCWSCACLQFKQTKQYLCATFSSLASASASLGLCCFFDGLSFLSSSCGAWQSSNPFFFHWEQFLKMCLIFLIQIDCFGDFSVLSSALLLGAPAPFLTFHSKSFSSLNA